jgi:hypothetical protein
VGDYPYYESWSSIRVSPKQSYINDFNAINELAFVNAPDVFTDITEESSVGSGTYSSIVARVDSVVDTKTGNKLGDDWKTFIFYPNGNRRSLGTRFQWNSNYWISVNASNYESLSNSCVVRRCNNTLQKRKPDGTLVQEPCIIDYGYYIEDAFNITRYTVLAEGEIIVIAQNNANTRLFDISDEVPFNGQYFKIESKKNFLNNTTYDDDSPLIVWKMTLVNASGDGDITPTAEILIMPEDVRSIVLGDTQTFTCYKFKNGIRATDTFTFSVDPSSQVSASKYTLTTINGNSFSVKNNARDESNALIVLCTDVADATTQKAFIWLGGDW